MPPHTAGTKNSRLTQFAYSGVPAFAPINSPIAGPTMSGSTSSSYVSNAKPMAAIVQINHSVGVSFVAGWLVGMGMVRAVGIEFTSGSSGRLASVGGVPPHYRARAPTGQDPGGSIHDSIRLLPSHTRRVRRGHRRTARCPGPGAGVQTHTAGGG